MEIFDVSPVQRAGPRGTRIPHQRVTKFRDPGDHVLYLRPQSRGPPQQMSPCAVVTLLFSTIDSTHRRSDRGSWIVDRGPWTVDRGSWIVDRD